jgi:hypothetical protein
MHEILQRHGSDGVRADGVSIVPSTDGPMGSRFQVTINGTTVML